MPIDENLWLEVRKAGGTETEKTRTSLVLAFGRVAVAVLALLLLIQPLNQ